MINKYSIGAEYFSLNGLQNYLTLQLFVSHFATKNDKIYSWKSKVMLEERVTTLSTTEEIFYPEVSYCRGIYDSKFKRNMFKTRQCVFSS